MKKILCLFGIHELRPTGRRTVRWVECICARCSVRFVKPVAGPGRVRANYQTDFIFDHPELP